MTRRRRAFVTIAVTSVALVAAIASSSGAQVAPTSSSTTTTAGLVLETSTTTTTQPDGTTTTTTSRPIITSSTTTTTAPNGSPTSSTTAPGGVADPGGTPAPDGADTGEDADGTTSAPPRGVPPEAQKIIASVQRSGPSNSRALLEAVEQLVDLGLTREEAIRRGFGRFPVAGSASYVHDWLFPRYGPTGFRFHLGTDVFAAFGTPLRAVSDGTVTSGNGGLGGLWAKVHLPDGTYFYYAHLSGLAEGFVEGQAVKTGDIIGYVGDSGNAKGGAPHLHFGVYPQGGAAVDPKPILDKFLAEAIERLPAVIQQARSSSAVLPEIAPVALPAAPTTPRSMLATSLLRSLSARPVSALVSTEALYAGTGNPASGGIAIAEAEAQRIVAGVDWEARSYVDETRLDVLRRSEALARIAMGPFVDAADRDRLVTAVVWRGAG